ncbi:MAG: response regulator transcription factor [Limnothrix sp.]
MKRVLVVDDDPILRKILQNFLAQKGYQIEVAASGDAALEVWEQYQPDLIVSDVNMPSMDGLEFCRRLRAMPSGQLVPFIFLSGQDELEDRLKGHSSGADDYVTKPFEMQELLAKIERQLERTQRIHAEIVRIVQSVKPKATQAPEPTPEPEPLPLTPAEIRVFWEVVQGLTNKQISEHLFISPRTVQTHLSNILGKLQLENRSQLVRFAYENGYQAPEGTENN